MTTITSIVLDKCPHCGGVGTTKRGRKCRHCLGHGGWKLNPPSNARGGNDFARGNRVKLHRAALRERLELATKPQLPVTVLLIRVAPSRLDDDNLRGSFKALRDELADWLGLNSDRDDRVRWRYDQTSALSARTYRAELRIFSGQANCPCCGQGVLPGTRLTPYNPV